MAAGSRSGRPLLFILALPVAFGTLYFSRDQFLPQVTEQVKEALPEDQFANIRGSFEDFGKLIIQELFSPGDSDADGLSNKLELLLQSSPDQADTNQDGFSDGEAFTQGLHPVTGSLISDQAVVERYQTILDQYPSVKDSSLPSAYAAARLQSEFMAEDPELAQAAVVTVFGVTKEKAFFTDLLRRLQESGPTEHALLAASIFVEQFPDEAEAYAARGFQHHSAGDIESAKSDYLTAIEKQSENAVVWNNLGLIYFEEGSHEEAESAFEQAIRLKPGDRLYAQRLEQVRSRIQQAEESL